MYRSGGAVSRILVQGMVRRPIDLTVGICRIFEIEIFENFKRFPEEGFIVNTTSDMIMRTLEGRFSLFPKNQEKILETEDSYIIVPKGQPFFIRENLSGQKYTKVSVVAIPSCEKEDFAFVS
jgi:hypothetical protein